MAPKKDEKKDCDLALEAKTEIVYTFITTPFVKTYTPYAVGPDATGSIENICRKIEKNATEKK